MTESPENTPSKGEEPWLTAEQIGRSLSPARGKRAVLLWLDKPECKAREELRGKNRCKVAQLSAVVAYLRSQGLDARVAAPTGDEKTRDAVSHGLFDAAIQRGVEERLKAMGPIDVPELREWTARAIDEVRRTMPTGLTDPGEVDRWAAALDKCQRTIRMLDDHVFEAERRRKEWIKVEECRAMMVRAASDYVGDVEAMASAMARELPGVVETYVPEERREEMRRVLAAAIKRVAAGVRAKRAAVMRGDASAQDAQPGGAAA